jgi:hypothetical protein
MLGGFARPKAGDVGDAKAHRRSVRARRFLRRCLDKAAVGRHFGCHPSQKHLGTTSGATSIGSRRSPSIREPSASCCAPKPRAAPAPSARPSPSPCRPWCANCPRPSPRHSLHHPPRSANGHAVVPRGPEFSELLCQINRLKIRGVQLQLVSVRKEVESLESVVILCQAPALEVLYVDIEEPLPV